MDSPTEHCYFPRPSLTMACSLERSWQNRLDLADQCWARKRNPKEEERLQPFLHWTVLVPESIDWLGMVKQWNCHGKARYDVEYAV